MNTYITLAEIAKILEWDRKKVKRWLETSGALVKRGGKFVTTPELLKSCFPEIYQEIMDASYDANEDSF